MEFENEMDPRVTVAIQGEQIHVSGTRRIASAEEFKAELASLSLEQLLELFMAMRSEIQTNSK